MLVQSSDSDGKSASGFLHQAAGKGSEPPISSDKSHRSLRTLRETLFAIAGNRPQLKIFSSSATPLGEEDFFRWS